MTSFLRQTVVIAAGLALAAGSVRGQDAPIRNLVFPQSSQQWINSAPLTLEDLKGKAVFLFFFEEESETVRDRWPTLLALAQRYAKEPVLFVAVNSGVARGPIEQYVKECRISWPVIVDPMREFEDHAGVRQIHSRNVNQVKMLQPDGTLIWGYWYDLEETIDRAIKTAKWKIPPNDVPLLLKPTWRDIEFGNYAAAASGVKKALTSSKTDIKTAAEKLHEAAMKDFNEQLAAASEALDAEERWKAYNLYTRIEEKFKGFDLPDTVEKTRKTLASDAAIKEEIATLKLYEGAARQLAGAAGPAQRKRAGLALEKIVKDKPETEGARKAQAALDRMEKSGALP